MGIEDEIISIRSGIKAGRFSNEASVSQGIVLRLLNALGWPTYDTATVWPEFPLDSRRVDYALCSPPSKPIALIKVKQIGQSDGAERQLFEYAFHDGVPMAILTDGREWNFFLPGEQGAYGERRVYKLDIVDRDVKECAERLERYLLHSAVASGVAIQAARDDYRNVSKERQMQAALPKAWSQLIADEDDLLLEIVADRVESLCGYKPGLDMVADFLKSSGMSRPVTPSFTPQRPIIHGQPTQTSVKQAFPVDKKLVKAIPHVNNPPIAAATESGQAGFSFRGQFHPAPSAIETLRQVFNLFIKLDPTFAERFAGLPRHGRTRRYLALNANELYEGRPDLASEHSVKVDSGWWMSTNHSKQTISRIIAMACDVAQVDSGRNLIWHLG